MCRSSINPCVTIIVEAFASDYTSMRSPSKELSRGREKNQKFVEAHNLVLNHKDVLFIAKAKYHFSTSKIPIAEKCKLKSHFESCGAEKKGERKRRIAHEP